MQLVKMEREKAEKEAEREEAERRRRREHQKRVKRMLEAAFDGDCREIRKVLKEVWLVCLFAVTVVKFEALPL